MPMGAVARIDRNDSDHCSCVRPAAVGHLEPIHSFGVFVGGFFLGMGHGAGIFFWKGKCSANVRS